MPVDVQRCRRSTKRVASTYSSSRKVPCFAELGTEYPTCQPLSIIWTDDHVPAIVEMWFCSQEGGHAIADVLFGDYNPDGSLPVTYPRSVGQFAFDLSFRPGVEKWNGGQVSGPFDPFGHGLSDTTFDFTNLRVFRRRRELSSTASGLV